MKRAAPSWLGMVALAPLGLACGIPGSLGDVRPEVATRSQEIRPTDGTGWNNNGYGIPAQSYDAPGGHFRIWYVTSGENAVDTTDTSPMNGVPDFVEMVGTSAETTYQSTVVQRGFRAPLDDSVYHDRPDYGGDGRFDIYLRLSGRGSDGYRVTEVCTDGSPATGGGAPGRCAGYFVMNPGYKTSHYPSERDGVEVLTSHELFHSIQDAYNAGQWRTWTEGTAVWNELQVFPKSPGTWGDYLGFVPGFFNEPERPFDQSMGAGAAAAYAYGSAVWAEFLSERHSPDMIADIWNRLEQPAAGPQPHFLDATEAALTHHGDTLREQWAEFTHWNLLTGPRAIPGVGYARAAEYPSVRFESDIAQLDAPVAMDFFGMSARYFRYRPAAGGSDVYVTLRDPLGTSESAVAALIVSSDGKPRTGQTDVTVLTSPGQKLRVETGDALLLVVSATARGARTRRIELTLSSTAPATPTPHDDKMETGGCSFAPRPASQQAPARGPWALLLLVPLALRARNARRHVIRAARRVC